MRLINVKTYELHEFFSEDQVEYAILSHTWGAEEITFTEMEALTPAIRLKTGFRKIDYTCQEAQRAGLDWAWVDTCCIDKSSSAELSEAINSMFRWYSKSAVCYVYLSDLDDSHAPDGVEHDELARCRWFTRGWCLQELLAPTKLVFFSSGWVELQKSDKLSSNLSSITGIEEEYLRHQKKLSKASVAKRMSWAANRQCTRVEDIAYCLMGIFDINMALLYGEGEKAFGRLQEEIWKEAEDHSLLAWSVTEDDPRAWALTGVFAESPSDFRFSSNVEHWKNRWVGGRMPSNITQRGIGLDVPIFTLAYPFSAPDDHWEDNPIICEMELSCFDAKNAKAVSLLVMGITAERKFTRIATVGHMAHHCFGTRRLQTDALNPAGRFNDEVSGGNSSTSNGSMAYIKKSVSGQYEYCSWNRFTIGMNLSLVQLHGVHFGTQVADFTAVNCPTTQPLDMDAVRRKWPASTHCAYDPNSPQLFVPGLKSKTVRLVRTDNLHGFNGQHQRSAVFELLIAGNIISPNEPRQDSLFLRCGMHFPIVKRPSSASDKSWLPWVCLDFAPWAEGGDKGPNASGPARHRRWDNLSEWAKNSLQPADVKTGIVATASTCLGEKTMHVTMQLEDTSGTGEHTEVRAPLIIFTFSHDVARPAWMDEGDELST